ncbi:MAG: hypothetical protein ABI663_14635 [Chryseolinea sp.]
MSKIDLSPLVNGMSGKAGNSVLRRIGNRTILTSKPKARTSEPTAKEKAHQERFKRAAAYAKAKMADPLAKAEYQQVALQKELGNVFAIAVKDFLKPPTIDAIKTDMYTGKVNDMIIIRAFDDFKVVSVKVSIILPNGTAHENGSATYDASTLVWKYTATKANATLAGTKISVIAIDMPANETMGEKVI